MHQEITKRSYVSVNLSNSTLSLGQNCCQWFTCPGQIYGQSASAAEMSAYEHRIRNQIPG